MGGGDVADNWTACFGDVPEDPERRAALLGVSAVVEMAAELAAGAVAVLDRELRYASASLVRQLIEAEYLIEAFAGEFHLAADWLRASPSDVRQKVMPKITCPLNGFSDHEYWTHYDHGGHPSPQGRHLLRFVLLTPHDQELFMASAWGDLAQHLRRVWSAVTRLLTVQHARFVVVESADLAAVEQIEVQWIDADPLAKGVTISALSEQ